MGRYGEIWHRRPVHKDELFFSQLVLTASTHRCTKTSASRHCLAMRRRRGSWKYRSPPESRLKRENSYLRRRGGKRRECGVAAGSNAQVVPNISADLRPHLGCISAASRTSCRAAARRRGRDARGGKSSRTCAARGARRAGRASRGGKGRQAARGEASPPHVSRGPSRGRGTAKSPARRQPNLEVSRGGERDESQPAEPGDPRAAGRSLTCAGIAGA